MAKAKYSYPDKPKTKAGYNQEWIASYLKEEAKPSQIDKYRKAIEGKNASEKRNIFYDMFIAEKPKKNKKTSFEEELKAIAKQKREEAKKAKEV